MCEFSNCFYFSFVPGGNCILKFSCTFAFISCVWPQLNPDLASLDLSGNRIGDAGVSALADALRAHTSLQSLNLSRNRIGDIGCAALGDAIVAAADCHLTHLDLSGNNRSLVQPPQHSDHQSLAVSSLQSPLSASGSLGASGAQSFFSGSQSQPLLRTQQPNLPGIGSIGAAALSRALAAPRCVLHTLCLTDLVRFGDDGARALARGLSANQSLRCLNVNGCGIGETGMQALNAAVAKRACPLRIE
jgi:hypothetical protein